MIQTAKIEYMHGDTLLEGFYAFDDQEVGKRPLVLVAHDWTGRNEFTENKAKQLAELGYVGFAMDMYGKGKLGKTTEEKAAFMAPLKDDRELLEARLLITLKEAKKLAQVDTDKIGAIGFCFGGLCVLDLARSGADVRGVVSFHGILLAPEHVKKHDIKAKILALHGHDDPMVPPAQVLAFETEMTNANVDWQVHIYSQTMHAFMNPLANDPAFGTVYNPLVARRAEIAMQNFFKEIF